MARRFRRCRRTSRSTCNQSLLRSRCCAEDEKGRWQSDMWNGEVQWDSEKMGSWQACSFFVQRRWVKISWIVVILLDPCPKWVPFSFVYFCVQSPSCRNRFSFLRISWCARVQIQFCKGPTDCHGRKDPPENRHTDHRTTGRTFLNHSIYWRKNWIVGGHAKVTLFENDGELKPQDPF